MDEVFGHFINLTKDSPVSLSRFVREALYNPEFGYYMRAKKRVGKSGDFYTSSSLSPEVFSALLKEAFEGIAKKYFGEERFELCEIGAEPELSLFENSRVIRAGEEIELRGNLFMFSNELLDAQPFDRFVFEKGEVFKTFCEFGRGGVELSKQKASEFEAEILKKYFPNADGGFVLDFSFDAMDLFEKICSQNWRGVLIFADYFRTKGELECFEGGTARSYFKHRASQDIFENAPFCDITFSPMAEPFLDILARRGFKGAGCAPQGAFFMANAPQTLRGIIENSSALSPQKRAIAEFLSPAHMGEVFRVLSAVKL